MMILSATILAAALSTSLAQASWTTNTIDVDGLSRSYLKYTPSTFDSTKGVVVFFHGAGGSSREYVSWDAEGWAEYFGFEVLVPDGSSSGGGGGGGGKPDKLRHLLVDVEEPKNGLRRLKGPGGGGGGSYVWNIEDTTGVDEVSFIHSMLAWEGLFSGPKLAMGFSNGAGMASLMCCHNSTDVIAAHVGCHIDDDATFDASCSDVVSGKGRRGLTGAPEKDIDVDEISHTLQNRRLADIEKTYSAIGLQDFFLDGLNSTAELYAQFAVRGDACGASVVISGCDTVCSNATLCPDGSCIGIDSLDNNTSPGFECYTYPGCDEAGRLCIYKNLGHEISATMTPEMYSYLTSNTEEYDSSNTGSAPGPSPGCDNAGAECGNCCNGCSGGKPSERVCK